MVSLFVISMSFISLQADGDLTYIEKLQRERDRIAESRDIKAEFRRWNDDIDKITNRREYADKLRDARASVRKELRRIF